MSHESTTSAKRTTESGIAPRKPMRREPSTWRTRDFRRRRRDGLHLVAVEIFNHEIEVLVVHGVLSADRRDDYRIAVPESLEKLIATAISALNRGLLEVHSGGDSSGPAT